MNFFLLLQMYWIPYVALLTNITLKRARICAMIPILVNYILIGDEPNILGLNAFQQLLCIFLEQLAKSISLPGNLQETNVVKKWLIFVTR